MPRKPIIKKSQLYAGFTVLELVMVIVLVGLLSATVIPRFSSTQNFQSRFYFDNFVNALSYSLNFEAATGCASQFEFYDATPPVAKTSGYSLYRAFNCDAATPSYSALIKDIEKRANDWQVSDLGTRLYRFNSNDIESLLVTRNDGVLSVTINGVLQSGEVSVTIIENGVARTINLDTLTGYLWQG